MKNSRGFEIIRKLKRLFPFPILRLFYFPLIYPYICFCSSVWMSTFPTVLDPIHHLHEKVAKIIQSAAHTPLDPLKIKDIYVLSLSSLANQYFQGDPPCCLSGLLK